MQKYICNVCAYVYNPALGDRNNGVKAGTPFDKISEDWVCPVCGKTKSNFSKSE